MTANDTQIKVSGQDAKFVLDITRPLGPRQTAKITGLLTGQGAVRLWQKLGFEIIGEIPEAFNHHQFGLTNAYIMYRKL